MTDTNSPAITPDQTERLLLAEWEDMLLKLSPERAVAAQASLNENLYRLDDFEGESLARYRCAIYNAHLDYWRQVAEDNYTPWREGRG